MRHFRIFMLCFRTNSQSSVLRLLGCAQGSFLVNTARGAIVELDALVAAVKEGHLAGAGVPVFVLFQKLMWMTLTFLWFPISVMGKKVNV